MNLTDEEIRIKVAEACGWKHVEVYEWVDDIRTPKQWADFDILPNYPLDLNACAEFEATLTKSERTRYADILCDMCYDGEPDPNVEQVITATARQRCLAYLKTKGIIP